MRWFFKDVMCKQHYSQVSPFDNVTRSKVCDKMVLSTDLNFVKASRDQVPIVITIILTSTFKLK